MHFDKYITREFYILSIKLSFVSLPLIDLLHVVLACKTELHKRNILYPMLVFFSVVQTKSRSKEGYMSSRAWYRRYERSLMNSYGYESSQTFSKSATVVSAFAWPYIRFAKLYSRKSNDHPLAPYRSTSVVSFTTLRSRGVTSARTK